VEFAQRVFREMQQLDAIPKGRLITLPVSGELLILTQGLGGQLRLDVQLCSQKAVAR